MKKIAIIIFVCTMIIGCGKRTESKLVGEWEVENVGDCDWNENASWTFYSGGELKIYGDRNIGNDHTHSGTWEIFTRSLVTPYVSIEGFGTFGLDGVWNVEKINSRKLILHRVEWANGDTQGSHMRREFLKK